MPRLILLSLDDCDRLRIAPTKDRRCDRWHVRQLLGEVEAAVPGLRGGGKRIVSYDDVHTVLRDPIAILWARGARRGESGRTQDGPWRSGVRWRGSTWTCCNYFPLPPRNPNWAFRHQRPLMRNGPSDWIQDLRLWIIFEEYNTDIVWQFFYLEPTSSARTVQQGILSAAHPCLHRPAEKPDRR